jgi:hypothetical protein
MSSLPAPAATANIPNAAAATNVLSGIDINTIAPPAVYPIDERSSIFIIITAHAASHCHCHNTNSSLTGRQTDRQTSRARHPPPNLSRSQLTGIARSSFSLPSSNFPSLAAASAASLGGSSLFLYLERPTDRPTGGREEGKEGRRKWD